MVAPINSKNAKKNAKGHEKRKENAKGHSTFVGGLTDRVLSSEAFSFKFSHEFEKQVPDQRKEVKDRLSRRST
jgi:hypothetical protein